MPEYNIAFSRLGQFLPFLHIVSVSFFMALHVGFWLISRHILREFDDVKKYENILNALKTFGGYTFFSLGMVLITGGWLYFTDMQASDPMAEAIVMTKFALWILIGLNLLYMAHSYKKCLQAKANDEIIELHEGLVIIIKHFIVLNIAVALFATYLGVAYRDF